LVERRANAFVEPERVYALVLFGASCFGIYAFFGWYFSPPS
jgi:multisubunit Na+/H+ antiporter MnhB subunit